MVIPNITWEQMERSVSMMIERIVGVWLRSRTPHLLYPLSSLEESRSHCASVSASRRAVNKLMLTLATNAASAIDKGEKGLLTPNMLSTE